MLIGGELGQSDSEFYHLRDVWYTSTQIFYEVTRFEVVGYQKKRCCRAISKRSAPQTKTASLPDFICRWSSEILQVDPKTIEFKYAGAISNACRPSIQLFKVRQNQSKIGERHLLNFSRVKAKPACRLWLEREAPLNNHQQRFADCLCLWTFKNIWVEM